MRSVKLDQLLYTDVDASLQTYQKRANYEALDGAVLMAPLDSRYTQVGFDLISVLSVSWLRARGPSLARDDSSSSAGNCRGTQYCLVFVVKASHPPGEAEDVRVEFVLDLPDQQGGLRVAGYRYHRLVRGKIPDDYRLFLAQVVAIDISSGRI